MKQHFNRRSRRPEKLRRTRWWEVRFARRGLYSIVYVCIFMMIFSGCLGVYEKWSKSMHPYNVGDYSRKIDNENFEWLVIVNSRQQFILVFRYQAASRWYIKDKNGIGELSRVGPDSSEFEYVEIKPIFDNYDLSSIESYVKKRIRLGNEREIIAIYDQHIVAVIHKTNSYNEVYIDMEKMLASFPGASEIWIDDGRKGIAYNGWNGEIIDQKTGREIQTLRNNSSVQFRSRDLKSITNFLMPEATN